MASDGFSPGDFTVRVENTILGAEGSPLFSDFLSDDRVFDFIAPFQEQSILHAVIAWVAESALYDESNDVEPGNLPPTKPEHYGCNPGLPVDAALLHYGFNDDGFGSWLKEKNTPAENADTNDVFHYLQDLQLSGRIEEVADRIAAELFLTLLADRDLMAALNENVADYVAQVRACDLEADQSLLFEQDGQLRSAPIPGRVRTLILNRDGRRCVRCGAAAATGRCIPIVPLCRGGLNDVANLQLVCTACYAKT